MQLWQLTAATAVAAASGETTVLAVKSTEVASCRGHMYNMIHLHRQQVRT